MRWIDKAREIAKTYRENCKELQKRIEQQTGARNCTGLPVRGGKISKPVESEVERRQLDERLRYLRQATTAVEYAIEKVMEKPQGQITVQLFNMVYYYGTHRLYGAAQELHIAERTAIRYNTYFLKMIGIAMGFIKSGTL